MEQGEYLYVIGVGSPKDWEAGAGSIYYIEDRQGEKALPVFTTREHAEGFTRASFNTPDAHMSMLESGGFTVPQPLTEEGFKIMPLDSEGVAEAAAIAKADYLVRDPRAGEQQEIMRLT